MQPELTHPNLKGLLRSDRLYHWRNYHDDLDLMKYSLQDYTRSFILRQ